MSLPDASATRAFETGNAYFNGYGDSLIDDDRFQQRLGVAIWLSNLF